MKSIKVRGACQNNLKNIDIDIPLNSFTVICGLSGSGKSSLAFETLFAEGQKRYLQNTSSYLKQYIDKQKHPDVKSIENLPPALALEQKNQIRSSRSTVATLSGISDHLRLLFERLGQAQCPKHKIPLIEFSASSAAQKLIKEQAQKRAYILAPFSLKDSASAPEFLKNLKQSGFSRLVFIKKNTQNKIDIKELSEIKKLTKKTGFILVDRLILDKKEQSRLIDSLNQAFSSLHQVERQIAVLTLDGQMIWFSKDKKCLECLFQFPYSITSPLFSFNSPLGACKTCEGYGNILSFDIKKACPDPRLSIKKGAIYPFRTKARSKWRARLLKFCEHAKIDILKPWCNLTPLERKKIWEGDDGFPGVLGFFKSLEKKKYKAYIRIYLAYFRAPQLCPTCKGTRLKKEISYVLLKNKNFQNFMNMSLGEMKKFFDKITFSPSEKKKVSESIDSLTKNLQYLNAVGLSYLKLNRPINSLSGGELQRLQLSKQLGMSLSQVLYILDEPTVGLHPSDTQNIISILKNLKELGNTIIVVEHDKDMIESSHFLIEMGPQSGHKGGEVIWSGKMQDFMKSKTSNTRAYLQKKNILPRTPRQTQIKKHKFKLSLSRCSGHNLKDIDVEIPLHRFVVVTGVSGSGKSSLIRNTLYPALVKELKNDLLHHLSYTNLKGSEFLKDVIMMDQSGVGRTSRSFVLSYIKVFDSIRKLFAETSMAKSLQVTPSHFSLNVEGGRCPSCKGMGFEEIDMVFMDPIKITCETCKGLRFQKKILDIKYKGKNILDVFNMTIEEASSFFQTETGLLRAFCALKEVGLSYLNLGQNTRSLSGGEKQRLKLAKELLKSHQQQTLYIFDEPTKGLHFKEIESLLKVVNRLVENGGSVIIIEHNLEVIKEADYILDIGPKAGEQGGQIVFQGNLDTFLETKKGLTVKHLREYLSNKG